MNHKLIKIIKQIIPGLFGLIGASIVLLLVSNQGAGISPDSAAYISVARSLAEGSGFVTYDGYYYVLQPPLYPIFLAFAKIIFNVDPIASAGYLNALLFGLIVYISGVIFLKQMKSNTLVIIAILSVMLSFPLIEASFMALSEPLFILLSLLFLFYVEKYRIKQNFSTLVLLSFSASLACLTRYTGVILILSGIICIFVWGRSNFNGKVRNSIIFSLLTTIPVSAWIIRNVILTGALVGHRAASSYTFIENLDFWFQTVFPWFFPLNVTGFIFVIMFILLTIWVQLGIKPFNLKEEDDRMTSGPSLVLVLLYSAIIIISSTTTAYDKISDRLLSPLYIPLIFIIFTVTCKILEFIKYTYTRKYTLILLIVGMVLFIRLPISNLFQIIIEYSQLNRLGYNSKSWKENKTVEFIGQHKEMLKFYSLYSNEPEAVYLYTNLKTKRSPAKTFYNSPKQSNVDLTQKYFWKNDINICLVWFDNSNRSFLFTIEELKKNIKMKEVANLQDGKIFVFTNK